MTYFTSCQWVSRNMVSLCSFYGNSESYYRYLKCSFPCGTEENSTCNATDEISYLPSQRYHNKLHDVIRNWCKTSSYKAIYASTNEWINEWMNQWMNESMNQWMNYNEWISGCVSEWNINWSIIHYLFIYKLKCKGFHTVVRVLHANTCRAKY